MRFFLILLVSTFMSTSFLNAQIILNAESLRVTMLKDKENWAGNAGVSFSYIKNTDEIYTIATNLAVGYNGGENLWMIISNLNFNKSGGESFANSGVQHLRYNREVNDHVAIETFVQGQYDKIFKIDFRGLAGAGARFKLTKPRIKNDSLIENNRIYFGTLIMYEYEKVSELDMAIISKDFRNSSYLSFSLNPTDNFSVISTTYYQPRMDLLEDYRLSSEIDLTFGFASDNEKEGESFWDKLTFKISFSYNYDAVPVTSVPKTQYSLTNGLRYNF